MDLKLEDKVFVVTGGAKGIGEAVCRTIIQEGAVAVIVDKDIEAGDVLKNALGEKAAFFAVDLGVSGSCENVVRNVADIFGRIDGIVNNAGVNDGVGLIRGTPERFVQSMTNNVVHYYEMVHYALPHLKKSMGAVVNVSSKTALTGQGNTSGYVAAKGAILALTREWAAELAEYNIRVNAVVPAEAWTPMYEQWLRRLDNPKETLASITSRIPLGRRMTTAGEIADTIVFLLSSRATHITGQWIHVDGGYLHLDRALDAKKNRPQ